MQRPGYGRDDGYDLPERRQGSHDGHRVRRRRQRRRALLLGRAGIRTPCRAGSRRPANNGVAIATTPTTLADGKFYSYYLSGIYNSTTKASDAFVVEDPLPAMDYVNANVRFVNAISNSQPMTLYAKLQTSGVETAIGSTVAYKNAGSFVTLAPGIYDLSTRVAGSSTNVITRTGVSFNASRVYTISAYGDITATTGTAKPALDNTANR